MSREPFSSDGSSTTTGHHDADQEFDLDSVLDLVQDDELHKSRIASVLRLLNATLNPDLTRQTATSLAEPFQPTPAPVQVPERLGRFTIQRLVGRGSFGSVYKAFDEILRRDVAIKAINRWPRSSSECEELRWHEARAAASLNHPYLVPLYEILDSGNVVYLVSEFCDGPTLAQYLREHEGPLDPTWTADVILRLTQAVAHAHGRGLAHRDIKPSNIILVSESTTSGTILVPRLTDFGLVAEQDADHRDKAGFGGTIIYMAPEQFTNKGHDARAGDLYAIGLMMYQMLTGRMPYSAKESVALLKEICTQPVSPITSHTDHVSKDLDAICRKALAKDPKHRYASAQAFVDDLVRLRDGKEVFARPRSAWERTRNTILAAPYFFSLLAALFLTLTISVLLVGSRNGALTKQGKALKQALVSASENANHAMLSRNEANRQRNIAQENANQAIKVAYRSDVSRAYASLAQKDYATASAIIDEMNGYLVNATAGLSSRDDLRLATSLAKRNWVAASTSFRGRVEEIIPCEASKTFLVAGDEFVRIVDSRSGSIIKEISLGQGNVAHALAITQDERLIAVGIATKYVTARAPDGNLVEFIPLDRFNDHENPEHQEESLAWAEHSLNGFETTVDSIAFSHDSQLLAVGTRYKPLTLFHLRNPAKSTLLPSRTRNEDIRFAGQHRLLWLANSKEIDAFETADYQSHKVAEIASDFDFKRFACSADGRCLVATRRDTNNALLYDLESDSNEPQVLCNSGSELRSICCSPDAKFVVAGTAGGSLVVWNTHDLSYNGTANFACEERILHNAPVRTLGVNKDGIVLSGSDDGALILCDLNGNTNPWRSETFDQQSYASELAPDGGTAFIGCCDGSIWQLNIDTRERKRISEPNGSPVTTLTIFSNAQYLAAGWQNGRVAVAKCSDDSPWMFVSAPPIDLQKHRDVSQISFTSTADRLLVRRVFGSLQWLELRNELSGDAPLSLKTTATFFPPTSMQAAVIVDHKAALTLGDQFHYSFADADYEDGSPSMPGISEVRCHCFDSISKSIFVGCKDGRVRKLSSNGTSLGYSLRSSAGVSTADQAGQLCAIALTPDRQSIITGSDTGSVNLWDAETMQHLGFVWQSDEHVGIEKIAWSNDGKQLMIHQRLTSDGSKPTAGRLWLLDVVNGNAYPDR